MSIQSDEGRAAFLAGRDANDCPYTFIASPCWKNREYGRFNTEFRPLLDEWLRGWIDEKAKDRLKKGKKP